MKNLRVLPWVLLWLVAASAAGEEPVDLKVVSRIRTESFQNSKVMDTLSHLCEAIGARLTGSPNMKKANEWTRDQLAGWGLQNAHLESWGPFGRGWSFDRVSVDLVLPTFGPLIAIPKAWTPGTQGAVHGKALLVKLDSEADLEKYRGQLAGKILFMGEGRELAGQDKPLLNRLAASDLESLMEFPVSTRRPGPDREAALKRFKLQKALRSFLVQEKAVAIVEASERDSGVVRVAGGGSREKGEDPGVTALVMAAEHFNRVTRLLKKNVDVELQIDVSARFHDDDLMAYNTIAEIPGIDRRGEVVMLGAHLDSWHSGCGATDNGAGSAVTMEAVRILQALDVKPRRTIRIGLWTGEEQGLLGSRAYVNQHLASRPEPDPSEKDLPSFLRRDEGPITLKPEHAKLAAYFNLDNGSGKIRGVYLQGNSAVHPIFKTWLEPFADLGAKTLTLRDTGGTDHLSFDTVGLAGFQFIQDPLEYGTLTHHTNIDVYDHLHAPDLMQASAIMASFVYHAAMRDEMLPRKVLPKGKLAPVATPTAAAK